MMGVRRDLSQSIEYVQPDLGQRQADHVVTEPLQVLPIHLCSTAVLPTFRGE